MKQFCNILSQMGTEEEIWKFLKDLLNRQERMMFIRRLLIAEMLMDKKKYGQISEQLKCGYNTIARVQKLLNFGRAGYKKAIELKRKPKSR